ncbi:predicted protein [Histoplasma capsulatum var. duboisii H88]|uniref:Predicted protein n=1 Tax=Ajellomyces capsulatus (strain H88) TaxID=544711 RepID=F0UCX4_AJEC8|nr:predicted protein [Histoplasma capsulatum var. duboisii H88]
MDRAVSMSPVRHIILTYVNIIGNEPFKRRLLILLWPCRALLATCHVCCHCLRGYRNIDTAVNFPKMMSSRHWERHECMALMPAHKKPSRARNANAQIWQETEPPWCIRESSGYPNETSTPYPAPWNA